jgi:hypothetical protein
MVPSRPATARSGDADALRLRVSGMTREGAAPSHSKMNVCAGKNSGGCSIPTSRGIDPIA